MKHIVLLALLGLGITPFAQGQSVRLGVTGGFSVTRLTGLPAGDIQLSEWRLAGRGGVAAQAMLSTSGRLAVQTELLYSGQGYRLGNIGGFVYYRERLHYLQLPVLAQLKLANVWLEAGPEVSYLLGGHSLYGTGNLFSPSQVREKLDMDKFYRWEAGYVAGASYQFTDHLRLGLRYTGGLTPVLKSTVLNGESKLKNQTVSLQATYMFGK